MSGTEYHKIYAPYQRHISGPDRGKFNGLWARPEFDGLQNQDWIWSEKINGRSARIIWDGHRPRFGGRTDEADMPMAGIEHLASVFTEEMLEQQFHDNAAVIYGELCGNNMASGSGVYGMNPRFIIFDIKIGEWWMLPEKVDEIAYQMGLERAHTVLIGSVHEAVEVIRSGLHSILGQFPMEGLVGRPPYGLTARDGDRLLMKIKTKDFVVPTKENK
jgi:RNA ligase-like protein